MAEREREQEDKGFRVVDRRRFTSTGEVRADAPPEPPPSETRPLMPQAAPPAPAAPAAEAGKPRQDPRQRGRDGGREPNRERERGGAVGGGPGAPSRIDFIAFAASLATNALASLGALPEAQAQGLPRDPELAREYIDILGMLQDKTRGNLSLDEEQALQQMLTELRLQYVEFTRR